MLWVCLRPSPWRSGWNAPSVDGHSNRIELSPAACRIVEIDAGPPWRKTAHETRGGVVYLPCRPPDRKRRRSWESLRGHRAAVVVWDGSTDHRQVMVTRGSYEAMRAEALGALDAAGVMTQGVWADIAPVTDPDDRSTRRPVVVALSSAAALRSALQPLQEAGIRTRSVMTPAVALDSLARLRRASRCPVRWRRTWRSRRPRPRLRSCVTAPCSREGIWRGGYLDTNFEGQPPRQREEIARRLADELSDFFSDLGGSPGSLGGVRQVCVCGGLSELRTMTVLLMEHLDIEVETLDSLFGIDANRLPDPGDEFRERSTEMRLAWPRPAGLAAAHQLPSRAQAPGLESDAQAGRDRDGRSRGTVHRMGLRARHGYDGGQGSRVEGAGTAGASDAGPARDEAARGEAADRAGEADRRDEPQGVLDASAAGFDEATGCRHEADRCDETTGCNHAVVCSHEAGCCDEVASDSVASVRRGETDRARAAAADFDEADRDCAAVLNC